MLHLKVKRDLKELAEIGKFNDFLVLENYLDQCVKLRLSGDENSLKEAHDVSTIITRIFGILNQKFEGKFPVSELIEARKIVAKFIGLTFFKLGRECSIKFGPNCAINGPCCALHRLEGLKEAHELFPKLFEPFGIILNKIDGTSDTFFTSLLAVLIDFKTQIVVSDLALKAEKGTDSNDFSGLSIHLENLLGDYYGNSMEIPYLKGKLQQRAVQLRGILEQQPQEEKEKLSEILRKKYPIDLFECNLRNILRNVYAAFPEPFLSELVRKSLEEPKKTDGIKSIIDSSPSAIRQEGPSNTIITDTNTNTKDINNATNRDIINATNKDITNATNKDIINATNKDINNTFTESPFKNFIISGKFFRGILEPVDERFAAIIEVRDVNVKQYLNQRKKKNLTSEKITIDQARKEEVIINSVNCSVSNVKSSLMERHDSAERISWETQKSKFQQSEIIRQEKKPIYSPVDSSSNIKRFPGQRGRRMFSEQEVLNLIEGIRRFGRDWRRILDTYEFNDRTNVDLKDKARNLDKLGLL